MTQDKTERHLKFASAILLALFVGLTFFVVSIVRAAPNPDGAASTATFRAKCAMCHGSDGAGSEVGKSMNVPDLRSPVFQKLPDAQLAQIISDGKGGMPPFKSSLSEEQITRFGGIHSLATPKEIARILFNAVLQLQMSAIPSVSSRLNRGTS